MCGAHFVITRLKLMSIFLWNVNLRCKLGDGWRISVAPLEKCDLVEGLVA